MAKPIEIKMPESCILSTEIKEYIEQELESMIKIFKKAPKKQQDFLFAWWDYKRILHDAVMQYIRGTGMELILNDKKTGLKEMMKFARKNNF